MPYQQEIEKEEFLPRRKLFNSRRGWNGTKAILENHLVAWMNSMKTGG
jgi:hypothetical protein